MHPASKSKPMLTVLGKSVMDGIRGNVAVWGSCPESQHNFAAMRTVVNLDVIWGTGNTRISDS